MSSFDAANIARWRNHPDQFIEEVLVDPETDGQPYQLLPAQRAFFKYAFQIGGDGRLLYPEQIYGCPKKSGKTATAAMHIITTTMLYGGRYSEGYCCANDLEQAQGRVYEAVRRIVEQSPLLRRESNITQRQIRLPTGGTITAIPSDYAGAAGGHPTISSFDELWGFTSEGARRLWDELVPVPTKKISMRLVTTYAGFSGESVLLEELYKRGKALPEVAPGLHAGDGMLFFWTHEPIAPWQTPEWIEQMRATMRPTAFQRMIRNNFVTSDSPFIGMDWFDACVDPALKAAFIDRSVPVWVGVDASVKRDSTAIAAVTWDRQAQKCRLLWHSIFQPTKDDPIDFEEQVEATIFDLHKRFRVKLVRYDPFQMAASAQRLAKAGVKMEEYPQSVPNITAASQNLYELIKAGSLHLYADDQIRLAFQRAVAVEGSRGWKIDKSKQSHKIDIVVAMGIACLTAVQEGARAWDSSYGWVDGSTPAQTRRNLDDEPRYVEKGWKIREGEPMHQRGRAIEMVPLTPNPRVYYYRFGEGLLRKKED